MTDDILDQLFHGCALRAYLEVYAATKQFPPDAEKTRRLAYQYYEQELAEKNRRKQPVDSSRTPRHEADQDSQIADDWSKINYHHKPLDSAV